MCVGCHNIVGYKASFPEVYRVPQIAGQSAKYIAAALNAYKTGDRKHPTMRGIADSLTEQDIADIAGYYENLGKEDRKAAHRRQAEPRAERAGRRPAAEGRLRFLPRRQLLQADRPELPEDRRPVRRLPVRRAQAYKTENNPAVGRNNGVMGAIAKQFSNAELKVLANYVGSLEGEMATVPEPRFHRAEH
jgi:cytochrome c553